MTKVKLVESKKFKKYLELMPIIYKPEKSNSGYKNFKKPDELDPTGNRFNHCEAISRGADLDDIVDVAYPECCRVELSKAECKALLKKTYDEARFLFFQGCDPVNKYE